VQVYDLHTYLDNTHSYLDNTNLSFSYSTQGAIQALKMAFTHNKTSEGFIHHSDRGIQYCSKEYTLLLKKKKAVISMTQNSDPYENAIAERVNGILKTEF
jgi:putative transposase